MSTHFTPQQAKIARSAAQLSQGRVATAVGINRSYLSQFESGKYLLNDATLIRLREYYSQHGAKFESSRDKPVAQFEDDSENGDTLRLRDGFLLPQELDEDHADALLNEYAENRHRISNICSIDLGNSGFLGFGIDEDKANKRVDEVFGLMARNYAIVEELQGHQITHFNSKQAATGEKKKVCDFVTLRLKPYVAAPAVFNV